MLWRVNYEYQDKGTTFFGSMVCDAFREETAKLMIGHVIYRARPNIKELFMSASEAGPFDFAELGLSRDAGPGRMD